VRTFELPSGRLLRELPTAGVRCLALSEEARFLAAGQRGGDVALWDLHARQVIAYSGAQIRAGVDLVEFLPGDRLLALSRPRGGEQAGTIELVSLESGADEISRRVPARRLFAAGWAHTGLVLLGERCVGKSCALGIFKP
jgi:hypothetical protein